VELCPHYGLAEEPAVAQAAKLRVVHEKVGLEELGSSKAARQRRTGGPACCQFYYFVVK